MNNKLFTFILSLLIFLYSNVFSNDEVYIKFRVDNEIITNIDIINEKNYLIALNNTLKDVPEKKLKKLSANSLIKEKIKTKEILKYFDLKKLGKVEEEIIANLYKKMGFKNEEEFLNYLTKFDLNFDDVKNKLNIEFLWNRLIFKKYNTQVVIDEKKLKNNLSERLADNNKEMLEYNLSEIVFDLQSNENLENKYKLIEENIDKYGFKKTSSLFSISNTSNFGGEIGWINKTQLSNKIINNLNSIEVGKYTNPIQINNAFLILKINDVRKVKKNINFENEYKKLVLIEKNRQLNNFSIIHFNKIKKNIDLSEN